MFFSEAIAQNPGGRMSFTDVAVFNSPGPGQGVVRYYNCGNDPSVNITDAITMEFWIWMAIPTDNQKILGKVDADAGANFNDGYMTGIANSRINPEIWTPTNQSFSEGFIPPVSTWHHVAVSYTVGGDYYAYLNGNLVYEQAAAGGMIVNDDSDLIIGIAPWDLANFMTFGKIDEVRLWNIERTAGQIKGSMFRTLTGNEAGLVMYQNFDNDDGSDVIVDLSTTGNDCTKVGMDETNILPSDCVMATTTTQTMFDLNGIWFSSDAFLQDPRVVTTTNGLSLLSNFNGLDTAAFVIWGHNNEGGVTSNDLPANSPSGAQRSERIWHTTTFGSIVPRMTFNLTDVAAGGDLLPNDMDAEFYTLLKRNSDSEAFVAIATGDSKTGDDINFNDVPVEDAYYAIAVADAVFETTGIFDISNNSLNVSIFPNPGLGKINIEVLENFQKEYQVKVFDGIGNLSKEMIGNSRTTQLNIVEKGVYFIQVVADKKQAIHKLIIAE